MVFSLCKWGTAKPRQRLVKTAVCCASSDMQVGLRQNAGPSHWNAPDMVEVSNGRLTPSEDHAHFAMWSRLAAPLIASNDLHQMNPQILSLLTNE